ncbi:esterase [Rhizobium sp. CF080]|uniref:alpha/beta hydrolase-fold protein n=1 Tax=Rhizobium sp. (strain CF080) TaxID=1144310 RepID=UPI00027156EA|nr:alpha/beta hydrolase-fold protein [Rhizobium sp. CF080]EUB99255.1 esterase [Rhizobium sp. CF080]
MSLTTIKGAAVAALVSMQAFHALAESPLTLLAGQPVTVTVEANMARRVFVPRADAGDYLKGRLAVSAGRFDLDLVDAKGDHLRRFAADAGGAVDFQFIAADPERRLVVTAKQPNGSYSLVVDTRVAQADQRPPPPSYLSRIVSDAAATFAAEKSTEAFWQIVTQRGAPLVEDGLGGNKIVTFVGRGAKRNIRLFGAPSGDHEELLPLAGSDIWFRSFVVPTSTRLSYQLAFDVPDLPGTARERRVAILATAKADPLNHHPWPADAIDAYNQDSVLELAEAPPQPWVEDKDNPQGQLTSFSMASARLGNTRQVTIYRPAGFRPDTEENVLLFVFDADEYLKRVPLPRILDNMIAAGVVPPTVAVFVANPDREARARELPANDQFADFMAEELLPRILRETGLPPDPGRTVLAGSSYGGLASATVAMRHPEAFGNVLSMSGSFWWSPAGTPAERSEYIAGLFTQGPHLPLRFFLSAGLFETASGGTAGILETNRHLRDVLTAKKMPVFYREYAGGHDYLVWRGIISDGLIALFPGRHK